MSAMKKTAGRRRLMSANSNNERSVTFMRSDTSSNKEQQRCNTAAVDVQIIQDQVLFGGSSRQLSAISRGSSKAPIVAGYNSVSRCTPIIVS